MKELFKYVKFQYVLAVLVVLLSYAFLFYMASSHFPKEMVNNVGDVKIGMIQLLTAIVMFYFGSSLASHKKDDTMQKMADNQAESNKTNKS